MRAFGHEEAITFLVETNHVLETPLPILEMITGAIELILGNITGSVHIDVKNKQRAKVSALLVYIARANKSELRFFWNIWQASCGKAL